MALLPDSISFEQGACLGIPGLTAYQAVTVAGPVEGSTILIQGGAGAVGHCAIVIAKALGATVIATVRSERDAELASRAGAHYVIRVGGLSTEAVAQRILEQFPEGVRHVVEVAFDANITADEKVLRIGGSIAAYATHTAEPTIPFWPLLFKNIRLYFIGSDDFSTETQLEAASSINRILMDHWPEFEIAGRFPLESIAEAYAAVEDHDQPGRVVIHLEHDEWP